jgi:hypothetical protein
VTMPSGQPPVAASVVRWSSAFFPHLLVRAGQRPGPRREFIAALGGAAAAWPLVVRAQQRPSMPLVASIHIRSSGARVTPGAKRNFGSTLWTQWTRGSRPPDFRICRAHHAVAPEPEPVRHVDGRPCGAANGAAYTVGSAPVLPAAQRTAITRMAIGPPRQSPSGSGSALWCTPSPRGRAVERAVPESGNRQRILRHR